MRHLASSWLLTNDIRDRWCSNFHCDVRRGPVQAPKLSTAAVRGKTATCTGGYNALIPGLRIFTMMFYKYLRAVRLRSVVGRVCSSLKEALEVLRWLAPELCKTTADLTIQASMSGPLERVLSRQVVACLDSNPAWSVDEVQSYLLKTHREYQRKPQTPLRSAISRALLNHRSQQSSTAPNNFVASLLRQNKQAFLFSFRQPSCISSGGGAIMKIHETSTIHAGISAGSCIKCAMHFIANEIAHA